MLKKLLILSSLIVFFQVINADNGDLSLSLDTNKTNDKSAADAKNSLATDVYGNLAKVTLASIAGVALGKAVLTKVVWKEHDHQTFEVLLRLAGSGVMFYGASNIVKDLYGPISSHFFKFEAASGVALPNLGDH